MMQCLVFGSRLVRPVFSEVKRQGRLSCRAAANELLCPCRVMNIASYNRRVRFAEFMVTAEGDTAAHFRLRLLVSGKSVNFISFHFVY